MLMTAFLIACVSLHPLQASKPPEYRRAVVRHVTMQEARTAIGEMIDSPSFLSEAPGFERIRTQIGDECKKTALKNLPVFDERFFGNWECILADNSFSYSARPPKGNELLTLRGHFFLGEKGHWVARTNQVSRTALVNFFEMKEYAKIRNGMTTDEVSKILGTPPGAYFAGVVSLEFPEGRRQNWPFSGTSSEFRKRAPWFFSTDAGAEERAWISNDLAIWISFSEDGRVMRKSCSPVRLPGEGMQSMVDDLRGKER